MFAYKVVNIHATDTTKVKIILKLHASSISFNKTNKLLK